MQYQGMIAEYERAQIAERSRQEWIEIPVPTPVSEETFTSAQQQLESNRHHSPRRTAEPSLLQGRLV